MHGYRGQRSVAWAGRMALAALCLAPTLAAAGGIYKWVDKSGVTHYTNVPGDRAQSSAAKGSMITTNTPPARQRAIYKFRDGGGVTHYTDRKPKHGGYVVVSFFCPACDPKSKVNWTATKLNLTDYANEINLSAAQYGVDPALVRAIVHAESAFNPEARSRKGAQGLMQLMPATASQYGVTNAYDARENIQAGTHHLAGLLKQYNGDIKLVAAAYNAGEGAVKKYGGVPPYDETRVYVERVGILHKRYQNGG